MVLPMQNAHECRSAININKLSDIEKLEQYIPDEDKVFNEKIFN